MDKRTQHLRTNQKDITNADFLLDGEIALSINKEQPSMYFKDIENNLVRFCSYEEISKLIESKLSDSSSFLKTEKLTKEQYDALEAKDPNTLYVIINNA